MTAKRVAIVTGASRGIGKATALALARQGVRVAVAARTEVAGPRLPGTIHETCKAVEELGGEALPLRVDVTREEEVVNAVARVVKEWGAVDILVNNAGVGTKGLLVDLSTKRWDLILSVNMRGTFLFTKNVLPHMIAKGAGYIVNLSSVVTRRWRGESVVYVTSKAAIEAFTTALAEETREHRLAVLAVAPDYTATEGLLLAMPGVVTVQTAEEWGDYIAFLVTQDPEPISGKVLSKEDIVVMMSNGARR